MEQEVATTEWQEFLESFSRRHQEWLVTLNREGNDIIRSQPLKEIRLVNKGILLKIGEDNILIHPPSSIRLRKTQKGADESIEFISSTSTTTLLIDSPVLPETVDGMI